MQLEFAWCSVGQSSHTTTSKNEPGTAIKQLQSHQQKLIWHQYYIH